MRTFSAISGLPVYCERTGKRLGSFADLYINEQGQVAGFLLDKKGLFQRDLFFPLDAIRSIGQDGIFIQADEMRKKVATDHLYSLKQGKKRFYGKPIMTFEGDKLGLVEDVYFMEEMGTIIGYEVTEGLLSDLTEGRKVVKTNSPLTVGEEVLVIRIE